MTAGTVTRHYHGGMALTVTTFAAALALAAVAALFSISGMVILFPGGPVAVVAMAATMEAGKLTGAAPSDLVLLLTSIGFIARSLVMLRP